MNSTYSISEDIFNLSLKTEDLSDLSFGRIILENINKAKLSKVICDLSSIDIIQVKDIKNIEKLTKLFQFNNIDTIVCGINAYSASVIFHFLDDFYFKTALNIQRAIDDFKNL